METCLDTEFKCCEDGVTAALSADGQGCRSADVCLSSLFGCCADGYTPALGHDELGCPLPTTEAPATTTPTTTTDASATVEDGLFLAVDCGATE